MKLRCIHCSRQADNQVTLSDTFECIDTKSCNRIVRQRLKGHTPVCIWSDCGVIYATPKSPSTTHRGIGVYTEIAGEHAPEYSGSKYIGFGTVPEGEWLGFLHALSVAVIIKQSNPNSMFKFFADAQAVVRCFTDVYKPALKFKPYYNKAKALQRKLGPNFLSVLWVRREYNKNADRLANEALKDYQTIK